MSASRSISRGQQRDRGHAPGARTSEPTPFPWPPTLEDGGGSSMAEGFHAAAARLRPRHARRRTKERRAGFPFRRCTLVRVALVDMRASAEGPPTQVFEEGHCLRKSTRLLRFPATAVSVAVRTAPCGLLTCPTVGVRGPRKQEFLDPREIEPNGMILDLCGRHPPGLLHSSVRPESWPGVIGTDRARREADFAIRLQAPCTAGPRR